MSHALRNSLILFIVLLLFASVSWGYIHYYQLPQKKQLTEQLEKKKQELKSDQQIADHYTAISNTYDEASKYFNNYEKTLYRSSNEDKVYDFLDQLNRGPSYTDFNFTFKDSTQHPKYGVLDMDISGNGRYRNVVNFVREIELSKPLNKIIDLEINPINKVNSYDTVSYNFHLKSYYDRSKILEKPSYNIYEEKLALLNNPFFPLVHDIEPNEKGQLNVDKSKLVALSTNRVFLIDQNGVMQQLSVGDKVYLGKLSNISLDNRTATFTLNKGGIVRKETMKVEHENQ